MRAFEAGKEVMDVLRARCSALTLTLEGMLQVGAWGHRGASGASGGM